MSRLTVLLVLLISTLSACNKKQEEKDGRSYGSWTVNGKKYTARATERDTTINNTISLKLGDKNGNDEHMLYMELPPVSTVAGSYTLDAGVAGSLKIHTYTFSATQQRFLEQYQNANPAQSINISKTATVAGSNDHFNIAIPEITLYNSTGDSIVFSANITDQ